MSNHIQAQKKSRSKAFMAKLAWKDQAVEAVKPT